MNCPAGTVAEKEDRRPEYPIINEFCRNFRTQQREAPLRALHPGGALAGEGTYRSGKLEGRYRAFTEDGETWKVLEYSRGHLVSERLTLAGLRDMVRRGNESLQGAASKSTLELKDDHTVVQTTVMAPLPPGVKHDQNLLRAMVLDDPRMCRAFTIPSPMNVWVARYVDSDGQEVGRVDVTRAYCAGVSRTKPQTPP